MAKYYAYNPHGSDSKYIEITEPEYRQAVRDSQRYFISFGSCVLESRQPRNPYAMTVQCTRASNMTVRDRSSVRGR